MHVDTASAQQDDAAQERTFDLMGARATVLADGHGTAGTWEAFELHLAPGARSPLHTLSADKLFYVGDGTVTLVLGEESTAAGAGQSALVPAGTPHCYRNDTAEHARLLVVVSGTGQLAFLRGMSRLTAGGPAAPVAVAEHAAAHGVTLLPPRG
jgi:quercetin dioxygenase-like cupin family protein